MKKGFWLGLPIFLIAIQSWGSRPELSWNADLVVRNEQKNIVELKGNAQVRPTIEGSKIRADYIKLDLTEGLLTAMGNCRWKTTNQDESAPRMVFRIESGNWTRIE